MGVSSVNLWGVDVITRGGRAAGGTAGELFAAHQIAQAVVLVEVDSGVFTPGFRDAVLLLAD